MLKFSRNSIEKMARTASDRTLSTTQSTMTAKSYRSIPGPSPFKFLLESFEGGQYYNKTPAEMAEALSRNYGPVVKIPGLLNIKGSVMLTDPDDFELTYRTEGPYPHRILLYVFQHYIKKVRPEKFNHVSGLVTEHGEEWWKLRSIANPIVLSPTTVNSYTPQIDQISIEFIDRIKELRDSKNETPANFMKEVNKWAMEAITNTAFDRRLNLFKMDFNDKTDRAVMFVNGVDKSFELTFKLEWQPSLWEYLATPTYKEFLKTLDQVMDIAHSFIDESSAAIKSNPSEAQSVLRKFLKMDEKYALPLSVEFLFVGFMTTAAAAVKLMYYIAKNPEKQERLRQEILSLPVDEKGILKPGCFNNAPYLRACLKETMRLAPVTPGVSRSTAQDLEIKGYHVPKGTTITMLTLCHHDANIFKNPTEFIPERWLRDRLPDARPDLKATHPFVYLPFGFGPRACIGRRVAEMENYVLMTRLLKNFRIEYNHPPLVYSMSAVPTPINDLKFKLIDV